MSALILDGKKLAEKIQQSILSQVQSYSAKIGRVPGLGVILVGENPASQVYVAAKGKYAEACGLKTFDAHLPKDASHAQVAEAIQSFNENKAVDGILMQLPLPGHLQADSLLDLILPNKDADGLHPFNQGLLMRGGGSLRSCTPLGSMRLIDLALSAKSAQLEEIKYEDISYADLSGKNAIVIGRSILVGKPISLMLLERNATVTMAHSKTANLKEQTLQADIVIAAVGRAGLVKGDWIKPGAIVIDVGINRLPDGKLTGDVDFAAAALRAGAITPVPKGVGPMTIAMLVHNTLQGYKLSHAL